jgi:oligopeptide transport system substrate-binding protein
MPGYDPNLLGPDETSNTTSNVALARRLLQSYADDQCGDQLSRCPPVFMPYGGSLCYVGVGPVTDASDQAMVRMWQQAFPGYPIKTGYGAGCGLLSLIYTTNAPQIFDSTWIADYPDPQDWLSLQFGLNALNNIGSVNVPIAKTLMAEADQEVDSTQRTALYNQAEQLLVTNVAWIPIGQDLAYIAVRSSVAGFALTELGYPSLDQLYGIQLMKR